MQAISASRSRRGLSVVTLATLLIGLLLTTGAAIVLRDAAHRDAQEQFDQSVKQTGVAVEREITRYFEELNTVGAFVASAPDAGPKDFERFVTDAGTFRRLPSMAGVFFLQRVEEADLPGFLEREKATRPDFSYFEIGTRVPGQAHYILTYYVPNDVDLALPVGTDTTPITSLTDLMGDAGARGTGIMSSFQQDPLLQRIAADTKFPLIETLLGLDFFIGMPVYSTAPADGTPPGTPIGWVGAPIDHFEDVVNAARTGQPDDIGLRVTADLTQAGMAQRTDLSRVAEQHGGAGPQNEAAFTASRSYTVDGVTFRFDAWSTADADALPTSVPIVVLGGVLGSVLAAGVVEQRRRARDRERAFAAELSDRAQFQRDIVDSVTDPMVVLDAAGCVTAANDAWGQLRGRSAAAEGSTTADNGRRYLDVLAPAIRAGSHELEDEIQHILGGASEALEVDVPVEQQGRRRWYAVRATPLRGGRGGAVVVHTDITERKHSHDELELKASRDPLTGLLNRSALEDEINSALVRARADGTMVAALFIDLDGFKAINDTHGHAVGDDVLRAVARSVAAAVRTEDRVGRLGGDEFVVLIESIESVDIAARTAERILAALSQPIVADAHTLQLGASIGVAVVDSPLQGSSENLLERADEAMYEAKQAGGSHFRLAR